MRHHRAYERRRLHDLPIFRVEASPSADGSGHAMLDLISFRRPIIFPAAEDADTQWNFFDSALAAKPAANIFKSVSSKALPVIDPIDLDKQHILGGHPKNVPRMVIGYIFQVVMS